MLLRELLAVWAPTIEEIHFGADIEIDFGQAEGNWAALAACHQLRAFSLQPRGGLPAFFLTALAAPPHFHTLTLSWSGPRPCIIHAEPVALHV